MNDRFIMNNIRLALEAASLQWMEGEKEPSGLNNVRKSQVVGVPKDSWKIGACLIAI